MTTQQSFSKNNKTFPFLEDNTIFRGHGFGATQKTTGEVVFSTSLVAYHMVIVEINIIEIGDEYAAT